MSNRILSDCIKALTSRDTPIKGIDDALEESKAKSLFKALHKKGFVFDEDEVLALAIENNWPEKHAKKLAKLAQHIGDGRSVKMLRKISWGETAAEKIINNHRGN
ncbi:hypothetical protein HJP15_07520 [Pseudoalteromonas sp. NEC-BIFX-2020_002]|uniref:hypothetical protein n=1 Tax=Pseudoalteromonas sp. NEC-BIFX-2020_002 TaxID=2732353 RepID=UPI001477725D|nr:hypothetical protein [Pseudoalteromonas sp. NEC-BIFX-2020_002]NNG42767.1 hypothetical protein [Pseudoalteromonas sp. NEC-BIFX-2020_002]